MISLGALIALPLGAVQNLLARETAHLAAVGNVHSLRRLLRGSVRSALFGGVALTAAGVAASGPIGRLVSVESAGVVATGLGAIAFFAMGAILYGFLQGLQRFSGLGLAIALSGLARPVLAVPVLLAGFGVLGALGVNILASALAVVIAGFFLKDVWGPAPPATTGHCLERREVAVMVGGALAFASLTNTDVVLANALLTDHQGGLYAAASLVAKLTLLVSLVVVTVLLPKATSRVAEGRSGLGIMNASVAVTAVLSAAAASALFFVPEDLVVWAFGDDFKGSASLLGLFGLAMVLVGIVNVYLFFYLAHRNVRFPLLVGLAAVVQVVAVLVWHPSPRSIILVTLVSCGAVLAIHEVIFPYSIVRSWRLLRPSLRSSARGET